jgi:hypothetical protein
VLKFIGWLLIVLGVLACLTVIGIFLGAGMIVTGCVILGVVQLVERHEERADERARMAQYTPPLSVDPAADERARRVSNSMFGR